MKNSDISGILEEVRRELRYFDAITRLSNFFSVLLRLRLTRTMDSRKVSDAAKRL